MKKLLLLILVLVYGFSSMGMSVSLHYCCGKLKDIKWTQPKQDNCGAKHVQAAKCCDNKSFAHNGNAPHDFAKASLEKTKSLAFFLYSFTQTFYKPVLSVAAMHPFDSPVKIVKAPLTILYCTYLI